MNTSKGSCYQSAFRCAVLSLGLFGWANLSSGQAYPDNQTPISDISNSNQDPTQETRRSDHFRVIFGHYCTDSGQGGMSEAMAQGNLQEFEWMWHRWVVEDGLYNINTSALRPDPMPGNYRANFWFLMTENDGGGGGSYNSMDSNGFFWAMGNPGLESFDPYSGDSPHEWGDCWWGTDGGYLNTQVGGNLDECMGDWGMLQFLNSYPYPDTYIANGMYTPIHGRDYFESWPIFEMAIQTPGYGYPYMNQLFSLTNATVAQQEYEYFISRMIRLDPSGAADKRGAVNDLWGNMAKRLITWDFQRQQWLAQANSVNGQGSSDPGTAWSFYQRCRTPLVQMPGTNGWYRPSREHLPQEFGWNIIPLAAMPGTTVTCNFQPQCDPVRQSDWRACLVAVSTNTISANNPNGYASYSTLWNAGANSITLSADQNQLYLVVIATPLPIGTEVMSDWWAYLEFAGLQFPYAVSFTNAAPLNVVEALPTGVTWKTHTNPDGTVCKNIASTVTVASTAYVGSNAMVIGSAQVLNSASIQDYAVVRDSAVVSGNAVVSGHGEVRDTAQVSGFAKVRDWGRVFGNAQVSGYAKVIEHANCGDSGNVVSGSAVIKGTTYIYSPSTFNGCLIMDGDSADGNGTTPASYGVHFGWQWGQNGTSFWNGLTNNNYQYCGLTFENTKFAENGKQYGLSNNPVFAVDQYGINHGFLMNGCRAAVDTGASTRSGYVLPLNGTNQYVELHNSLNDFNDTTIAVWFKWAGGAADQRIWSLGDGSNKLMCLTPDDSTTGNLRFMITDGNTTNYLDGSVVPLSTWTHVAVVFAQASSNSTLYVNGAPVATNAAVTLFSDSLNAPLMANANYLGRGNAGNYFQGSLDDFRVFMRSLAASDVLALYNTAAPGTVTPVADANPPSPNPATWLAQPYAISDSAITMSATPGTNTATGWVEYYFTCTSGGGHDSGWVSFNKYTDCGLTPGTACTYTVKMRNGNGNTTTASATSNGATTPISSIGAASFAYGPVGITSGQITMTATTVTNASGKTEYSFTCTSGGGHNSGWLGSPGWTDTGLATGGSYTYTVTVRDGRGNTSAPSAGVQAKARDDAAPLFPAFQQGQWSTMPYPTINNSISMTAATATDPSGVQYYFHCSSSNAPDSGWQSSPTYVTPVLADGSYSFQYMLRDQSPQTNQSGYSTIYTATVTPTTGYHPCTFAQLTTLADDDLVTFTGTVVGMTSTNYVVRDTNSTSTITVWPNTYGEATDPTLVFETVSVSGHLYTYTNYGGRLVSYATLAAIGSPAYTISGTVSNLSGLPLTGATVYLSGSPNASSSPATTTVTDANGNYSMPALSGTWYVAAGSTSYNTSADQVVTVVHANVHNINFALTPKPQISGQVTDQSNGGAPVAGATVAFKTSANAMSSPTYSVTTDANGNYGQVVAAGTWYVAAGKAGYGTTADQSMAVTGVVTGVNFSLKTPAPRNVPSASVLLFAVVADSLPPAGSITNWPIYSTTLPNSPTAMSITGTPAVDTSSTNKWEKNAYSNSSTAQGFLVGTYSSAIVVNGATIVMAVKPARNSTSTTTTSCIEIFGTGLSLGLRNNTGRPNFYLNGTQTYGAAGAAVASGAITVLSLVVQPGGAYTLYTNGAICMSGTGTALTSLAPTAGSNIRLARGDSNTSSYNGDLGDVYVYAVALSDSDRQQLETDLSTRFNGTPTSYSITASAGGGGAISPGGSVSVYSNANQTFTITPNTGYGVASVTVDGTSMGAVTSYTFTNVTAAHAISATFTALPAYTITASAGTGGTISPSGAVTVYSGNSQTFTIAPNTGYRINSVTTDGVSRGAVNTYTFSGVTANHAISATFTSLNRNVPKSDQLLFSVVADSLPASGGTGPWATFCPAGQMLSTMATPTVQTLNSRKWEQNLYADGDGFLFQRYATPIACNGATIILMAKPAVASGGEPWTSIVDIFYDRLCLGIKDDNGVVCVKRNVNTVNTTDNSTVSIPAGQATVLSLVVQPDGSYKVWANGAPIMNVATTGAAFTSMNPDHTALWGSDPDYTHYVNVGRNDPDGWTTFNGNIGDVFVYTNALSDTDRQTLEGDLTAKFIGSTITASAATNGSISPSGAVLAAYGASQTFAMTPNLGYAVSDVVVDGNSVGALSSFTFTNITASHTIAAYFGVATYTITASAGANGAISPAGTTNLTYGQSQTYAITPDTGYAASVVVDGVSQGAIAAYTFTNISTNHAISATFTPIILTISASAGSGGTISPSGSVPVSYGSNQSFTITPGNGYDISSVAVDGVSQGAVSAYTFSNVIVNHAISAAFASLAPPTLAVSANGSGGLNITWPDTYSGQLLWSPILGPGAVWTPVGGTPAHIGGLYQVTVTPGAGTAFYGLGR